VGEADESEVQISEAEIAFVVESPRRGYRYDVYTRHGCRKGVSQDTWQHVYKPRSQPIQVPDQVRDAVIGAWEEGKSIRAALAAWHPSVAQWAEAATAAEPAAVEAAAGEAAAATEAAAVEETDNDRSHARATTTEAGEVVSQ
jgi:hypothetical protein